MKKQNRINGKFASGWTDSQYQKAKIYGDDKGLPWDDSRYGWKLKTDPVKYFLVDFGDDDFYFYDPILDVKSKFSNNRTDIDMRIGRVWKEILYSTLQREFPDHMDKIDQILGIAKHNTEDQVADKLTLSDIKIGSLYYNFGDCTVCRIIEVVGRLIYASWHKGPATPYSINSFRKATQKEVDNYLKEAGELKESLE